MEYFALLAFSLIFYIIACLISLFSQSKKPAIVNVVLMIGLVSHALLIYITTISNGINLNFSNSLLIVSWVTVFFYYFINRKFQFHGLENLTLIPALIIILSHPFLHNDQSFAIQVSINSIIHIIIAILSYSLLTVGAIFSIFILLFQNNLTKKYTDEENFSGNFSLLSMENILFKIYLFGFILLSITLFSGILFTNEIFGASIIWNHKTIFSFMAWITYGAVLLGRMNYGWRGKKAVVISLIAFIFLILSYFGTKFVLEILLVSNLS